MAEERRIPAREVHWEVYLGREPFEDGHVPAPDQMSLLLHGRDGQPITILGTRAEVEDALRYGLHVLKESDGRAVA